MKKIIALSVAIITLAVLIIQSPTTYALQGDYDTTGSSQSSCTNLTSDLRFSTTNSDVTTLQNYLNVTGYMTVEATGYFGNVTLNAVKSYQTAHSLDSTGFVGPLTRAAIQRESCGTTSGASSGSSGANAGSVVCPAGYSCIAATQTPVACPLGYVCTQKSAAPGSAATPTYVEGSFYRTYLSGAGSGGTTNRTSTTTNATQSSRVGTGVTATDNSATAANTTIGTSIDNTLSNLSISSTTYPATLSKTQSGATISVWTSIYVDGVGMKVKSMCGPNQFYNSSVAPHGCKDNFLTSAPIALNPSISFEPSGTAKLGDKITDPYCPGVIAYDQFGGSRFIRDASPTADRLGDKSPNFVSLTQTQSCVFGEASKNASYNNPWITLNNLFGLINIRYPDPVLRGTNHVGSNFCKSYISMTEAKKMDDTIASTGGTANKLVTQSRFYIATSPSLGEVEDVFTYTVSGGQDDGRVYWWNGVFAGYVHNWVETYWQNSDIKNPEFLALFNAMQFGAQNPTSAIQICLDNGYKSNFPAVAGHYQSVILKLKALGWI
ncbi:MAG: peptidoglycan-binding domain-containing protein [Candidatus Taylorbacteria bacterium]